MKIYELSAVEVAAVERLDSLRRDIHRAAVSLLSTAEGELGVAFADDVDGKLREAVRDLVTVADKIDGITGSIYSSAREREMRR